MKNLFEKYWNTEYSVTEWTFMKSSLSAIWLICITYVLWFYKPIKYPLSFCKLIDCNITGLLAVKILLTIGAIISIVFYIQEKHMRLSLCVISVISIFVFTVSDSMGFYDRYDMISCVFIAQLLAYLFFSQKNLAQRRVQFPIQAIAACYTMAAVNKLLTSGIDWAFKSEGLALQAKKGYMFSYADYGTLHPLYNANVFSQFMLDYPLITEAFLIFSLLLEFCALVTIFDKRLAISCGVLLLIMHSGILVFINVFLFAVVPVAMIFLINPVYFVYIMINGFKNRGT